MNHLKVKGIDELAVDAGAEAIEASHVPGDTASFMFSRSELLTYTRSILAGPVLTLEAAEKALNDAQRGKLDTALAEEVADQCAIILLIARKVTEQ